MLKSVLLSTLLAAAVVTPAMSADTMAPGASSTSAATAAKRAPGFTQKQARIHLVQLGYKNISRLERNANGAWQGTAQKAGKTMIVAVRF